MWAQTNRQTVTGPTGVEAEIFTSFGMPGVRAEKVAEEAAGQVKRYLASGVPVGEHMADQLLLPLALAGAGSFVTLPPSSHTLTNIEVIRKFLQLPITVEQTSEQAVVMRINCLCR